MREVQSRQLYLAGLKAARSCQKVCEMTCCFGCHPCCLSCSLHPSWRPICMHTLSFQLYTSAVAGWLTCCIPFCISTSWCKTDVTTIVQAQQRCCLCAYCIMLSGAAMCYASQSCCKCQLRSFCTNLHRGWPHSRLEKHDAGTWPAKVALSPSLQSVHAVCGKAHVYSL